MDATTPVDPQPDASPGTWVRILASPQSGAVGRIGPVAYGVRNAGNWGVAVYMGGSSSDHLMATSWEIIEQPGEVE